MPAQNRTTLIQQLDETRSTAERQTLLKQLWRMDREASLPETEEEHTPPPIAPALMASVSPVAVTS